MIQSGISEPPVNEEKIDEAYAIISSVAFIEDEVYKQMSLLEEAVHNNFLEDISIINQRIRHLYRKIEMEYENADKFIAKYGKGSK